MNDYRYDISFRVKHPYIDPEVICSDLGLDAKHKWKSGEQRRTPKGDLLSGTYQETYCSIKLAHGPDIDLIDLISNMNSKLKTHKEFLESVRASGGVLEYFVGMYFDGCSGEIFNFEILAEMAELKIDLALDLYGASDNSIR